MAQRPRMPAPARRAEPAPAPAAKTPPAPAPKANGQPTKSAGPSLDPVMQPAEVGALQEKIARLAYDKWCQRGCPHGSDMQDWLDAEKELSAQSRK